MHSRIRSLETDHHAPAERPIRPQIARVAGSGMAEGGAAKNSTSLTKKASFAVELTKEKLSSVTAEVETPSSDVPERLNFVS